MHEKGDGRKEGNEGKNTRKYWKVKEKRMRRKNTKGRKKAWINGERSREKRGREGREENERRKKRKE